MIMRAITNLILFTGLLSVSTGMCDARAGDLGVGDSAPDFVLQGSDGRTHRLTDYRGKFVVVAWFPKAFTGG